MMIQRTRITEDLKLYMQTQNYILGPQSRSHHSLDSFVFTYTNLGGMRDNIKVEINYSLRCHLFEPMEKKILSDAIHTDYPITVLQPVELFAAKINALLSRAAARDLYDTYNMVRLEVFNQQDFDLLRKSIVFYTTISQENIFENYDLNAIDHISIRKIRTDLLPVIQKGEFIELERIKDVVKDFLAKLMILTPDEKTFLELFAKKQYRPDLLFDDETIVDRVRTHPMALWKMQEHSNRSC